MSFYLFNTVVFITLMHFFVVIQCNLFYKLNQALVVLFSVMCFIYLMQSFSLTLRLRMSQMRFS